VPVKNSWHRYVDSFVSVEGAHAECSWSSVALANTAIAAVLIGLSYAKDVIGLDSVWIPLAFLAAGTVNSLSTYAIGFGRLNLWAAKELVDFALYSLVFVSAAALSYSPASYGFLAVLFVVQQHYARQVALSFFSALANIIPTAVFAFVFSEDPVLWGLVAMSGFFYLFTAKATRQQLVEMRKALRAQAVLERIDDIVQQNRKGGLSDQKVYMTMLFHEMKNELAPALWNIDFALSEDEVEQQRRGALVDVRSSLKKAIDLLETAFGQLKEETIAHTSPLQQLPALVEQLSLSDKKNQWSLPRFGPMPRVEVKGPIEHLALAVRSLVENAYEAGADQVTIDAQISSHAAGATITVRDDGSGLPEAVQRRLFLPFNSQGKQTGSGLGIYLARRLAESADGTLRLVETGPEGTIFEFELPIIRIESQPTSDGVFDER
jgi:signal transduction histidine kinase